MLTKSLLRSLLILAVTFIGSVAHAAQDQDDGRWIFPGENLPANIPFVPLRTSATGGADVQVSHRDWFLLRPAGLLVPPATQPNTPVHLQSGPVLTDFNAQLYFRLVSGMILKESLNQMGMKPDQAAILVQRLAQSGKSIDTAPIADIGDLPPALDDLYKNWDRPLARLAVIPYLVFPLSVADSASSFQHFYSTRVVNNSDDKKCETIQTAAPLGPIQQKINELQGHIDQLSANVQNSADLLDQSNHSVTKLTGEANLMSMAIDNLTNCVTTIRSRVSSGAAMPSSDCLDRAKASLDPEVAAQWSRFLNVSLANSRGDFNVQQELSQALIAAKAKLTAAQQALQALQESRSKAAADLQQNQDKLATLKADLKAQTDAAASLDAEQDSLRKEFEQLQTASAKLDQDMLGTTVVSADANQEIKTGPSRNRIEAIKKQLPILLEQRGKIQARIAVVQTQIDFVNRAIATDQAQIAALDAQIGTATSGAASEIAALQKQADLANSKYLAATDANTFDDYILSSLSKKLITLTQTRDAKLAEIKKETNNGNSLRTTLANATRSRDTAAPGLQTQLSDLRGQLADYLSDTHMGWFLESDCDDRNQRDGGQTGTFLSRSPMNDKSRSAGGPAGGGKWGLFNIDYGHFQNAIDTGILLDLNAFIRMSVRYSLQNLDFAIAQFMDPSVPRCRETAGVALGGAVMDVMGSAFSIWNEGSDTDAKAKSYCRSYEAKQNYLNSLNRFIAFDGSVLDQALPRNNSTTNDQNERVAIAALAKEMRILTGATKDDFDAASHQRRDDLIRALIKVMAYDYDSAAAQAATLQTSQADLHMAGVAPGRTASDAMTAALQPGAALTIQSGAPALYNAPIADDQTQVAQLAAGDQVTVLPIESGAKDGVRAGWVRVQVTHSVAAGAPTPATGAYWAVASSLFDAAQTNTDAKSTPATTDKECPLRRLVTALRSPNNVPVPRYVPEMDVVPSRAGDFWLISGAKSQHTTPAQVGKIYVACEVFSEPGKLAMLGVPPALQTGSLDYAKAIAVRLVEVTPTVKNGITTYTPTEDYGGFVSTWFTLSRTPRVMLGPQLDDNWSVKR